MKYYGIIKTKSREVKIGTLIGSIIIILIQIEKRKYLYLVLALLLIAAVFQKKEHIVSEEGVDIKYTLFGISSTNRWKWNEITAIQPDYIKDRPNARLNINKDVTIRSFLFTPEDCVAVLELAKIMNPDMYVDRFTSQEQEEHERIRMKRAEAAVRQRQNEIKRRRKAKRKSK